MSRAAASTPRSPCSPLSARPSPPALASRPSGSTLWAPHLAPCSEPPSSACRTSTSTTSTCRPRVCSIPWERLEEYTCPIAHILAHAVPLRSAPRWRCLLACLLVGGAHPLTSTYPPTHLPASTSLPPPPRCSAQALFRNDRRHGARDSVPQQHACQRGRPRSQDGLLHDREPQTL